MTKKAPISNQSKAFIDAARELGCDDSEERFVETVRKIAKAPPQHRAAKDKDVKPASAPSRKQAR
jgi:hypothetical protein